MKILNSESLSDHLSIKVILAAALQALRWRSFTLPEAIWKAYLGIFIIVFLGIGRKPRCPNTSGLVQNNSLNSCMLQLLPGMKPLVRQPKKIKAVLFFLIEKGGQSWILNSERFSLHNNAGIYFKLPFLMQLLEIDMMVDNVIYCLRILNQFLATNGAT